MGTRTLSSFDPRLLELLLRAANRTEPWQIACSSQRESFALKFRLNQVKKLMREEKHPAAALANSVAIVSTKGTSIIILRRNDSDLDTILSLTLDETTTSSAAGEGGTTNSPAPSSAPNLDALLEGGPK